MTPPPFVQLSSGENERKVASLEQQLGVLGGKVSELELSLAAAKQDTADALESALAKEKVRPASSVCNACRGLPLSAVCCVPASLAGAAGTAVPPLCDSAGGRGEEGGLPGGCVSREEGGAGHSRAGEEDNEPDLPDLVSSTEEPAIIHLKGSSSPGPSHYSGEWVLPAAIQRDNGEEGVRGSVKLNLLLSCELFLSCSECHTEPAWSYPSQDCV